MEKLTFKKLFKPAKKDLGQILLIWIYLMMMLILINIGFEEKIKNNYMILGFLMLIVGFQIGQNREVIRNLFIKLKFKGKSKDITEINSQS
ncbi:MAG: hypothetical protein EPN82_03860 [Bacteroidetes bacterium]|nr:MAG: hypothetical protein EPN82_03860 [Bacteroidota bacterium]